MSTGTKYDSQVKERVEIIKRNQVKQELLSWERYKTHADIYDKTKFTFAHTWTIKFIFN